MKGQPTWSVILKAAEDLTRSGSNPFTLDSLVRRVQLIDPDRNRETISPIVQGMTVNAPGGPQSACGEVLHRVDRGLYELLDRNTVAPLPRTGQYDAIAREITTDGAVDDPIEFLRIAYQRREALGEVSEIVESRDAVTGHYGEMFSPVNLPNLTADQFKGFLYYENNRHWAGIHRHQGAITADMDHLRDVLALLLDESRPIAERLDRIARPDQANLVRGLGKAVFTPILLVVYPDKYGVWNSIAESAMKKLGLWPTFPRGSSFGQRYRALNEVLLDTAADVGVDLWTLDTLWWAAEQMPDLVDSETPQVLTTQHRVVASPTPDAYTDVTGDQAFTLERHLHDFLRDNWNRTELGSDWDLLSEGGDLVGYEYPTGVGRIDLLAHHRSEPRWLVIELKRGRSSDTTVGQVARYVGWVSQHLAESGETVEGLVISHSGDDRIRYALSVVPNISFKTYEVEFKLRSH